MFVSDHCQSVPLARHLHKILKSYCGKHMLRTELIQDYFKKIHWFKRDKILHGWIWQDANCKDKEGLKWLFIYVEWHFISKVPAKLLYMFSSAWLVKLKVNAPFKYDLQSEALGTLKELVKFIKGWRK